MAIAKVVYLASDNATPEVWMDTTDKTAANANMLSGITALKNDGTTATGNIATKTSSDMTVSGATVTAPAGYYEQDASKSVASGSATTPTTSITANPTISVNSSTGVVTATTSASQSITPTVSAGYVSSGTAGTVSVSGSNTEQLTVQAAQTIHPSTSDQTIASGKYLTGAQTIAAVTTTNLSAENIVSGVTVKIGDASDDDCVASVTGTASGGGGGGSSGPVWIDTEGYVHLSNDGNGGSTSFSRKDVNFYDYDGTIVASFTTAEFANLEALPANPSHDGLTAQGWNMPSEWTLANAKTYVSTNKKADWGQMYTTTSGATEIDVEFTDPNRLSPNMSLAVNGTVSVDWGDGSAATTVTGTSLTSRKNTGAHTYPAVGKYTIKVTATTGSWGFYGTNKYFLLYKNDTASNNRVYANCVKAVRIGAGCTAIGSYAFFYCASLPNLTIPTSVTSIGGNAFQYCYSLTNVTIPTSVTSIGNSAFYYCYSFTSVTIPTSVTSIGSGAFQYCSSLANITIPSSVTSIGNSAFSSCFSLASITIPSDVTSIGDYAFSSCFSLASVTIPSSVTSIGSYAFNYCYGLGSIHFKGSTPPTVDASDAFTNVPTDCIIYVPTGYLTDYTTASNYPDPNTYTYVEE